MNYQLHEPAALKPPVHIGYQNVGRASPVSNSSDAMKIVRAVSSLLSCTLRALYVVGVDMLYKYACPRCAKCLLFMDSVRTAESERA